MKLQRLSIHLAVAAAMAGLGVAQASQIVRPTNFGLGADAEIREETPTTNRGASNELASNVRNLVTPPTFDYTDPADLGDRNRIMYLQFDLSGITAADVTDAVLRLTVRNNNQLTIGRIQDTDTFDPDLGLNGLVYWGIPNSSFDESKIAYTTAFIPGVIDVVGAPGLTPDGDVGTRDFNSSAVPLGDRDFPALGTQNGLAVGSPIDFRSSALDAFLLGEIQAGNPVAVFAVHVRNEANAIATAMTPGDPNNWVNFNYLFNPKEMTTLNLNPAYDADTTDPNNPTGGPFSGASNANGEFSPQLRLNFPVPEPTSIALSVLAGLGLLAVRRR
ncbi:MAG: PEP-CTERM sorting domain-containing protein [Pirellulales bacterium]|nr:PEP-CTERM sorting domain-containing protein [Pirellulales bacterium]